MHVICSLGLPVTECPLQSQSLCSCLGAYLRHELLTHCCCLAVVASEKGVVVGRLTFREDGDLIDCQRMGVGGKAIPPNVDKVSFFLPLSLTYVNKVALCTQSVIGMYHLRLPAH